MALNSRKVEGGGTQQEPLDAGTYPARVVQIIGLGLQAQRPYQGQEKKPQLELNVTYELLDEFMLDEDGNEIEDKPRFVSERFPLFNLASERAKSTKRYYALDPDEKYGGDWGQIGATPCMVTLTKDKSKKNGKIYNNVSNVSSMRPKEADKAGDLINPLLVFDMDDPDIEVWEQLNDYIKDLIKGGLEFEGSTLARMLGDSDEGSAPEPDETPDEDEDW